MECPKCKIEISDKTGICKKCTFDVNEWDKLFKQIPKLSGYINDFANVISENIKKEMENYISDFYNKTKITIVVVICKNTTPLIPSQYIFWLFNEWKIGGKNNKGVMILLSMEERRIESEVGFGLEHILTDEESGNILDNIVVPFLKETKYEEGLFAGIKSIMEKLK
ncbi:MAG: TPM domain-containing protein [bacterium]